MFEVSVLFSFTSHVSSLQIFSWINPPKIYKRKHNNFILSIFRDISMYTHIMVVCWYILSIRCNVILLAIFFSSFYESFFVEKFLWCFVFAFLCGPIVNLINKHVSVVAVLSNKCILYLSSSGSLSSCVSYFSNLLPPLQLHKKEYTEVGQERQTILQTK